MHFNGMDLMAMPLRERRSLLLKNVVEVEHKILHSEQYVKQAVICPSHVDNDMYMRRFCLQLNKFD